MHGLKIEVIAVMSLMFYQWCGPRDHGLGLEDRSRPEYLRSWTWRVDLGCFWDRSI